MLGDCVIGLQQLIDLYYAGNHAQEEFEFDVIDQQDSASHTWDVYEQNMYMERKGSFSEE